MREIKFRAWCDKERRFYYFSGIFNQRPFVETSTFPQYDSCKQYVELKEPQLFAGLKDKNGKEIYEGDRCNVLFANGEKHKAEVVFIDGCFELNFYYPIVIGGHYNDRDYLKCSTVNHAVEVIGNIYENPELLKVEVDG